MWFQFALSDFANLKQRCTARNVTRKKRAVSSFNLGLDGLVHNPHNSALLLAAQAINTVGTECW
jgi:hypothetical protein